MKPGVQTSEFYVTAAVTVLTFLLVLFRVPKEPGDSLVSAVAQAIPVVAAVVAEALVVWKYIQGRNDLKKAAAEGGAVSEEGKP